MKIYNKLIRNHVLKYIETDGHTANYRILDLKDYKKELLLKLVEESKELSLATDEFELKTELADVCEVLDAIISAYNINRDELKQEQQLKAEQRGMFDERIFLESIDEQ